MPAIPDNHRFEPNKFALTLWLYTRKQDKAYGMNDIPGFFSTYDFPKDKAFFIAAIVLEIVGVFLLIYNGLSLGDSQFALIAIIGAIGLFAGDLLLAYFLHRNHQKQCLARNAKKVLDDPAKRAVIEDALKTGKVGNFFIILGFLLIAIIKFLGIVLLGTFDHVAIFIALLIMFVFIVYVHVQHTGYYIYGALTQRAFNQQLGLLNRGNKEYEAVNWNQYFESDIDLLEGEVEIVANQNHKITLAKKKETQKKKYAYDIISKGILTDRDVNSFLQKQSINDDQTMVIARECLKLQVKQYNTKT